MMEDPNVQLLAQASAPLRDYVAGVFGQLVDDEDFLNVLPGLILEGSPAARGPIVLQRLRAIAALR